MKPNLITNFIPINRKLFEHFLFTEKRVYNKFEAWIDLLQLVNYKTEIKTKMINSKIIKWGYAQYPTSLTFLQKRWGWNQRRVRCFINLLKKDTMVDIDRTQGMTLITICNYGNYNKVLHSKDTVRTQQGHSEDTARTQSKELKIEKKNNINTWKTDFNIYLDECRSAYKLYMQSEIYKEQEKFYPGVDVKLCIEKGFKNFWGTEAGWKHKKKSKIKLIDWKTTITNSIALNKVYEQK